ncbi:hypothetical protein [Gaoshiqia sediminis]|uniref:Uncharacterized protein n=1 Tax=Gaoshiqia sediminis TaxID=2986998 RepID=A0AA42CAP8_9BACT|nr:hypothetical protein [Gaoshiqia sediminis]MCW0484082.1 hypothetical protein [Gaoshiqia sediminis]
MNWTDDKIKHYRKSFNWARKGVLLGIWAAFIFLVAGIFSFWLLVLPLAGAVSILLLGAAKELLYDGALNLGQMEWADMKANLIGALHGLILKKSIF